MERRKPRRNEEKKIEISAKGKPFVPGTHVEFVYHRHHYKGTIEKQLRNSAIIIFDPEFENTVTAIELKQKIVISYSKMQMIK